MPKYTNYYKNTAVPVNTTQSGKTSIDEKRQRYFDNYYTKVQSVDPAQFDIVNGFLEGRNYSESVKRNLSISLLEIAKEQGLSITDLINQLSTIEDTLKLNTLLCILFNTTRNRTSVIGFSQSNKVISAIQRTILA